MKLCKYLERYKYALVSCRSLGPQSISNIEITQKYRSVRKKLAIKPGHSCLKLSLSSYSKGIFPDFCNKKTKFLLNRLFQNRLFLIQETFIAFLPSLHSQNSSGNLKYNLVSVLFFAKVYEIPKLNFPFHKNLLGSKWVYIALLFYTKRLVV